MKTEIDFEREAWARGDYALAALYGRIIELQKALGESLAENETLAETAEHYKRECLLLAGGENVF